MLFNSGTNSLYADALWWAGASTGSFPVDPDFTRSANSALDRVVALILRADKTWQWNDNNLSTELIDTSTALVSGTQKYAISVNWLKIARVRAKDSGGNWVTLEKVDRKQLTDSQLAASGTPYAYDLLGGYIYLFNIPNYASTGGLEVQFQRGADYFVVADTTKVPGFASQFHRLISMYAALDYLERNGGAGGRVEALRNRIGRPPNPEAGDTGFGMEAELVSFYSQRESDVPPNLGLQGTDYGASALGGAGSGDGTPRGFNF